MAYAPALADRYLDCLTREIERTAAQAGPARPDTIYIGGGTPSVASLANIARLEPGPDPVATLMAYAVSGAARLVADWCGKHGVEIWIQPKGPDTAVPFYPENGSLLQYSLPEFDVVHPFRPTEFTQVNPHINRMMQDDCRSSTWGRTPRQPS